MHRCLYFLLYVCPHTIPSLQMRGSLAAWPAQGRVWQSTRGRVSPVPLTALGQPDMCLSLPSGGRAWREVPGSSLIPRAGFRFSDVLLGSSVVLLLLDTSVIVVSKAVQV